MDTTSRNDRILTFINSLSMSHAAFADEIGVQRSAIAHIAKGRNRPSLDMIDKIIDRYPEVNLLWLLRGEGNMMSNTPNVISLQQRQVIPSSPVIDDSLKHTLFAQEEEKSAPAVNKAEDIVPTPRDKEPSIPPQNTIRSYSVNDFDEEEIAETPVAVQAATQVTKETPSVESVIPATVVKKEKKISRIVVFYDDNSYEEFVK